VTDAIKYVDCQSYNNSNGFSCNLDDVAGTARFWYVNCISRSNGAGWIIYEGPTAYVYNCLTTDNTWGIYTDAPSAFKNRRTVVTVKNTIFYQNARPSSAASYPWDLWTHRTGTLTLASDYNDFEQGSQSTCISWDGGETWDPYYYNSTSAPGSTSRTWYKNHGQDAHSLCSVDGEYANFLNASANDFHLTSSSSLIGKGTVITDPAVPELQEDADGVARPASGAWDIGPYQYASSGCSFTLSSSSASFTASSATGSVSVTASASGCAWTAASNASWITVTGGASGTGSGTVTYSVAANTGSARTGTMTIAGATFTVSQASAASPRIAVTPRSINFGSVKRGRTSSSRVTVTNSGAATLNVGSVTMSGTNANLFSETNTCASVAAGRSCAITVTFAPTGTTGSKSATMTITSNDPKTPTVGVSLSGRAK
jgi:hypothetical protein